MTIADDARQILSSVGALPDEDIDLAETALILAALEEPERDLGPYRAHLGELAHEGRTNETLAGATLAERITAINAILVGHYGYRGDDETYDDIRNANLMHVIDRRRGLSVTIGILYLHLARAAGWSMVGLNFPGHFLLRLEYGGERAILDPFSEGRVCGVADLRDMLKAMVGNAAELEPAHYQPVSNRDVLVRLQNNRKLRHINDGDIAGALGELAVMRLFAPAEPALWREAGVLEAHLGNIQGAIDALEAFVHLADDDRSAQQAEMLIRQLQTRLN